MVQFEHVAPEGLISEGVVTKDLSAVADHLLIVRADGAIESDRLPGSTRHGNHVVGDRGDLGLCNRGVAEREKHDEGNGGAEESGK